MQMNSEEMIYTMITGASSGLGKALAIQCAELKMNLILTALPGSNTHLLANELIRSYSIKVVVIEFDVTDQHLLIENIRNIAADYKINFLINNAGIGGTASIIESSLASLDRIIQVNIRSMVLTTQLLLPVLLKEPKSFIMNIASMAAFTPIAYKTVYPASKAFISSFSLGLREELRESSLSVSIVYPGPIMTNSNVSTRIINQGLKGRIGLLSTTEIAKDAIKQTLRGKTMIVPGFWNKINQKILKLLPSHIKLRVVSRAVKKEIAIQI